MQYIKLLIKILNSILIQTEIAILHLQNVNKVFPLLTLNGDCLLDDKLIHVINQLLRKLYLSLHVIHGTLFQNKNKTQKLHLK